MRRRRAVREKGWASLAWRRCLYRRPGKGTSAMPRKASPARLIIADDHALVREGIRSMLSSEPDLEVIGEAENGQEALELCRSLSPDLVLMDVRMPKMDGLEATRAIKGECSRTNVLMVTTHESPDYLLDAIRAGAAGYVLKDATKQQLIEAVRKALVGESPLNQDLAMRLLRRLAAPELLPSSPGERREEGPLFEPLTDRELAALRSLARGKTNREIAQDLRVSLSTAKRHIERIINKLGVSDRTQAAVRASELGLLPEQEE